MGILGIQLHSAYPGGEYGHLFYTKCVVLKGQAVIVAPSSKTIYKCNAVAPGLALGFMLHRKYRSASTLVEALRRSCKTCEAVWNSCWWRTCAIATLEHHVIGTFLTCPYFHAFNNVSFYFLSSDLLFNENDIRKESSGVTVNTIHGYYSATHCATNNKKITSLRSWPVAARRLPLLLATHNRLR